MLLCSFALALLAQHPLPKLTHGPLRGGADTSSMDFWARASEAGEYTFELALPDSLCLEWSKPVTSQATAENDFTLHWRVVGLQAGAVHPGYRIKAPSGEQWTSCGMDYRTSPPDEALRAELVFGSCCEPRLNPVQPVWDWMQRTRPDAIVLLGDTPYINSTKLEVQRQCYREFFDYPPVRLAFLRTAGYFTWDDHDYAANDVFGRVAGRENSRRAFLEYHASQDLGAGSEGVFQKFRRGPIEVFLLDTRWFADEGPSPLALGKSSLLGAAQIAWLQRSLMASTASFKVLACGMIWNGATRPGKVDCWGHWIEERDALLSWIGSQRISGVVLVGGDIHRSRAILHPVQALAGYDVPELITSPLAQSVIDPANVAMPGLLFDVGSPQSFLRIEAEIDAAGAALTARFFDGSGAELFARKFQLAELAAAARK